MVAAFTASETTNATVTAGGAGDPVLAVFQASCSGAAVQCADAGVDGDAETVTLPVTAGTTYFVMVSMFAVADAFTLTIDNE